MINDTNIHNEKLKTQINYLNNIFKEHNIDNLLKDISYNVDKSSKIIEEMGTPSATLIAVIIGSAFINTVNKNENPTSR